MGKSIATSEIILNSTVTISSKQLKKGLSRMYRSYTEDVMAKGNQMSYRMTSDQIQVGP